MKLTVVTAVRNAVVAGRTEKLRRCIESVHAQTCRADIEHLVVDGASTDGTLEILSDYAGRGWVRVISEKDHGVYEAMNNGLAVANGEYVLYLNSDDRFHSPRVMATALKAMERSGADYGYGDAVVSREDGRFDFYWAGAPAGLAWGLDYCHQAMMVKTAVLRKIGGFDLSYRLAADSHLKMRLLKDGIRAIHFREFVVDYSAGGLSATEGDSARREYARAALAILGHEPYSPLPRAFRWYRLGWRGFLCAFLTRMRGGGVHDRRVGR